MRTKWAKIIGVLLILSGVVFCYGAWDNTKPADNQAWNDAAGSIRDNWDAIEGGLFGGISVKIYGAVGDGVTDDSAAIQAAFDAAPNEDIPTTIFFPTGKYLLESTLVVPSGRRLVLRGAGKTGSDSTTLLTTNGNLDFIDAYTQLTNVFSVHGIQFEGPGIDTGTGNAITLGELRDGGTLGGPGYGRAYDSTISDCWFTLIPNICIFLQRASDYQIYGNGIENCNYGIYIEDGGNAATNGGQNIQLNRFYANKKAGIYIEIGSWDTINGNRFDLCGKGIGDDTAGAIVINNSGVANRSILIAVNTFDKNTNDIVLLGTVAGSTLGIWNTHIIGNTSDFVVRHFIYMNEAKRTSIIGNRINDASGDIIGTHPAIVIGGSSDGTIIFNNVNTLQTTASDYQATYGLELGASTTNTVLGTNSFTGKTADINIVSGATFAHPTTLDIQLLSRTVSVDLNAAGATEASLYTVPVGKTLIVDHIVIHTFSADTGNSVITLGKTGGDCDEYLGDQTLSGITASYAIQSLHIQVVQNATTVVQSTFVAAEVFAVEITTAAGSACTATFDLFGYLI